MTGRSSRFLVRMQARAARPCELGVRPEHLVLNPGDGSGFAGIWVTHAEYLGDELLAHVDLA